MQKRFRDRNRNARIDVEILETTDFKSPCIRVEREPATQPGGQAPPPVAMVANHVVVGLKSGSRKEALSELLSMKHLDGPVEPLLLPDTYLIELTGISCSDAEHAVKALPAALHALQQATPLVKYAEPNYLYFKNGTPSGDELQWLWGLHNLGQTAGKPGADIHALDGWKIMYESPNVVVAVVDSGIDTAHPDLSGNIWTNSMSGGSTLGLHGYDYFNNDSDPDDTDGHGTHVAGTIGALAGNGANGKEGVVGVTWNVKLMAMKFFQSWGGTGADAANAITKAAMEHANIIAGSWGSSQTDSDSLRSAIAYAESQNVLMVCAAGNGGQDTDVIPFYPSSYDLPNIISVTATNSSDGATGYDYGLNTVDLGAPGTDILSTAPNNSYTMMSGTSMAVPYVAGACALAWAKYPGVPYSTIKNLILSSVDPLPDLKGKCVTGGRLNLFGVLTKQAEG